jgi:hypothetical protein
MKGYSESMGGYTMDMNMAKRRALVKAILLDMSESLGICPKDVTRILRETDVTRDEMISSGLERIVSLIDEYVGTSWFSVSDALLSHAAECLRRHGDDFCMALEYFPAFSDMLCDVGIAMNDDDHKTDPVRADLYGRLFMVFSAVACLMFPLIYRKYDDLVDEEILDTLNMIRGGIWTGVIVGALQLASCNRSNCPIPEIHKSKGELMINVTVEMAATKPAMPEALVSMARYITEAVARGVANVNSGIVKNLMLYMASSAAMSNVRFGPQPDVKRMVSVLSDMYKKLGFDWFSEQIVSVSDPDEALRNLEVFKLHLDHGGVNA